MIKKLKDDGISLLIVEQNAKKAIEIADRTYLLEDGKIVLKGDKKIIKHKKIKNVYLGGRY
jgi:branched-chain amino acid transport system ATP-binding protein